MKLVQFFKMILIFNLWTLKRNYSVNETCVAEFPATCSDRLNVIRYIWAILSLKKSRKKIQRLLRI